MKMALMHELICIICQLGVSRFNIYVVKALGTPVGGQGGSL